MYIDGRKKDKTLLRCLKWHKDLNCMYVTPQFLSPGVLISNETLFEWALFTEAAAFWNRNL